ncbi:MAG: tRNA (adenosine(37)-N6)-threonylcarbamoyltransferase complex transferase subunit TsaD [Pseudomonadota bacterium]|nr:tRNA (adenosine(37)-N6)-threonylcarbamoyltransferase complex transferase subunit TsaD [Pseudomonadota bacterium]
MVILGVESSCDETGLALYHSERGLLGHITSSQHAIHEKYGGIVPELASRDHVRKFIPILENLLEKTELDIRDINLISFTNGPGLLGPLLTGASFSKSLAYSLNIQTIEVDHLEAHIMSPMMIDRTIKPPFLSLLVSGGHTFLSIINKDQEHELIGKSLDDAAGEVFDKVARTLGLGYPGGPEISKAASLANKSSFKFPRPMLKSEDYNFSFSGLKTSVINTIKQRDLNDRLISDIAYDFENSIIDVLITKTFKAAKNYQIKNIVVSGGVSANKKLRTRFLSEGKGNNIYFPDLEFSTDNGAMIAFLGYLKSKKYISSNLEINPHAISDFF